MTPIPSISANDEIDIQCHQLHFFFYNVYIYPDSFHAFILWRSVIIFCLWSTLGT
ncbi:hypothetical protein CAPTEDRAFT_124644 [Capitella teleta]|uniref:Uncharacterized protein n=1 Tax=Capitella teleta TaxID=283909 RepID=R7TE45_CAPTE|nr:hypothetical protein CAPTEDRAFT_124644 [Capitella teleta]|eukprot:ELT91777.1 hypothetical protein CAPTEDRAFT_124644 [Capitella teleta]